MEPAEQQQGPVSAQKTTSRNLQSCKGELLMLTTRPSAVLQAINKRNNPTWWPLQNRHPGTIGLTASGLPADVIPAMQFRMCFGAVPADFAGEKHVPAGQLQHLLPALTLPAVLALWHHLTIESEFCTHLEVVQLLLL